MNALVCLGSVGSVTVDFEVEKAFSCVAVVAEVRLVAAPVVAFVVEIEALEACSDAAFQVVENQEGRGLDIGHEVVVDAFS